MNHMKKLVLITAIVLGMGIGGFAQGGIFGRGDIPDVSYSYREGGETNNPMLPGSHGTGEDVQAPLGGGALLLIGFGAAYALKKRK